MRGGLLMLIATHYQGLIENGYSCKIRRKAETALSIFTHLCKDRYLYPIQPRPDRLSYIHGRQPSHPHPLGTNDHPHLYHHPRPRVP